MLAALGIVGVYLVGWIIGFFTGTVLTTIRLTTKPLEQKVQVKDLRPR